MVLPKTLDGRDACCLPFSRFQFYIAHIGGLTRLFLDSPLISLASVPILLQLHFEATLSPCTHLNANTTGCAGKFNNIVQATYYTTDMDL